MPRSRLRWRALAVLGALLSVMIDWPIGFAMPATNNQQIQTMTKINSCVNSASVNCSAANNLNLTNSDRVTDRSAGSDSHNTNNSSDSGNSGENPSSDSKNSPKQQTTMLLSSFASVDQRSIANSNRSIRPDRLMRIYNKRKRKKTVARLTAADLLRSIRTHNTSFNSDVNNLINIKNNISENQLNSSSETNNLSNFNNSVESTTNESIGSATVQSIVDNATISQYLSRTDRSVRFNSQRQTSQRKVNDSNLDRNERSANLSQLSGPARKIQLFIKNHFIQLLPDGTVNGTLEELSDYTILQRTTVDVGQIKIQGVATCLFLCMDQCGAVYGSKSFTDDCVFNESMEQHHYNTYSSTYNSNFRTLYLALNRHGVPRKVIIPRTRSLEKLSTYTSALTENVPQERVEKLIARTFGANRVKHGLRQLCDAGKPLIELTTSVMKSRPKCNNSNNANGHNAAVAAPSAVSEKLHRINNNHSSSNSSSSSNSHSKTSNSNSGNIRKKKKKRRCRLNEDELEHNCHRPKAQALKKRAQNRKCLQTPEECAATRKKNNNGKKQKGPNQAGQKKRKVNGNRKGKGLTSTVQTTTTILSTTPTTTTELETSTTTQTTTTLRSASTHTIRHSNEEDVSTEDSQQSSTETHEDSDGEDDDSSISSLGGHAQLVNGDDFLYDDEFDV